MKSVLNSSKDKIFYWLLAFVVITLPFPSVSLNSKAIIGLFVFSLFYNSFQEKIQLFKKNYLIIIVISIPFWLAFLGSLYTDNFNGGIKKVVLLLPFLIFPLTFYTVKMKPDALRFVLNYLTAATIVASLLALSKMFYFKVNNLGDYFFYDRFSVFLNIHTTYFSLLVVISFLHIFHQWLIKKLKLIYFILIAAFLVYVLYILSVRMSIIAMSVGIVVLLSFHIKSKLKWLALPIISMVLVFIFSTPNFQKRFLGSSVDTGQITDVEYRKHHWLAVSETISYNNLIFGPGTNANRDFLYQKYEDYGLTAAYENKYNAHNQTLEILLDYGWFGAFVFILALFILLTFLVRAKNSFGISVFVVFLLFFLTESILQRHIGVVIFSFLISLFIIDHKTLKMDLRKTLFYTLIILFLMIIGFYYLNTRSEKLITLEPISEKSLIFNLMDDFDNHLQPFWSKEVADSLRYEIVSDPLDETNSVLKVDLFLEDYSNGLRSEILVFTKDSIGYKTNYSFRFLVPENFFQYDEAPGWIIIHQWHDLPDPGFNWASQNKATQPPIHLMFERNREGEYDLVFKTGLKTGHMDEIVSVKWPGEILPDTWYTFSCEVYWHVYNNKAYSIPMLDSKYFINDEFRSEQSIEQHKIYRRNMYNALPNYFKFGLYRSGTEKHNRTIFLDDFQYNSERVSCF